MSVNQIYDINPVFRKGILRAFQLTTKNTMMVYFLLLMMLVAVIDVMASGSSRVEIFRYMAVFLVSLWACCLNGIYRTTVLMEGESLSEFSQGDFKIQISK